MEKKSFLQKKGVISRITRWSNKNTNTVVVIDEKGVEFVGFCSDTILESALAGKRMKLTEDSVARLDGAVVAINYEVREAGSTYEKDGVVMERATTSNSIANFSIEKLAPKSMEEMIAEQVGLNIAKQFAERFATAMPTFQPIARKAATENQDFEKVDEPAGADTGEKSAAVKGKAEKVVKEAANA